MVYSSGHTLALPDRPIYDMCFKSALLLLRTYSENGPQTIQNQICKGLFIVGLFPTKNIGNHLNQLS
jgi:hypothetical protein